VSRGVVAVRAEAMKLAKNGCLWAHAGCVWVSIGRSRFWSAAGIVVRGVSGGGSAPCGWGPIGCEVAPIWGWKGRLGLAVRSQVGTMPISRSARSCGDFGF